MLIRAEQLFQLNLKIERYAGDRYIVIRSTDSDWYPRFYSTVPSSGLNELAWEIVDEERIRFPLEDGTYDEISSKIPFRVFDVQHFYVDDDIFCAVQFRSAKGILRWINVQKNGNEKCIIVKKRKR